jgi:hypothetical protein
LTSITWATATAVGLEIPQKNGGFKKFEDIQDSAFMLRFIDICAFQRPVGRRRASEQDERERVSAGSDVKTGKRLWIFHTIPLPGEFGNETWEKDSWSYSGNTGMWGPFSVDEELETVYLPIELSTGDYYGGHRPGDNLFTESLLAVDLHTGKRKWHFQLVHHGIWDYDLPCASILADITVDGKRIKAVAQQAGLSVRVRSPDGPTRVADRRAACGADDRTWRENEPDAAVPDQASTVRASGHSGKGFN